jgi:hypothetical protein
MTQSIADILGKLGAEKDIEHIGSDPEEVLTFKCNPLAIIMLYTELHSTLEERDYQGVFNDEDDDFLGYNSSMLEYDLCKEEEFLETCALATDIIEYFREIITLKKLKGSVFSTYEENLSEFIKLCDNNQCKIKHLPIAVKLPQFFDVEQSFLSLTSGLDSYNFLQDIDEILYLQEELTPLAVWSKATKREKKEHTFLHFKTRNNNLVEYRVRKSSILSELFQSKDFLKCKLNVKLYGTTETHPLTGFTYFKSSRIEVDS